MLSQEILIVLLFIGFLVLLGVTFWKNREHFDVPPDSKKWTENVPENCQIYRSRGTITKVDPLIDYTLKKTKTGEEYEYESAIYDPNTQTLMTGSQFMEDTELVPPVWVYPAWDPNVPLIPADGSNSVTYSDFENDKRMIYNKCSLACCGPQYKLPFDITNDQCITDKDGNNRYVSSEYTCMNPSGTGCLCLTPEQAKGLQNGFE